MKYLSLVILAAILGCSSKKMVTDGSDIRGWKKLFNGTSTDGWHTYGRSTASADWKVKDGAIYLDTLNPNRKAGQRADLVTNEEFENYHLKLEWKISKNGNSGIMFNVHEDPAKYPASYNTGPEMQVLDNSGHADGKIFKHRAGDLYDLIASSKESVNPVGEWNKVEIISDHGRLEFIMNGEKIVSTTMWDDNWKQMIAGSKFKTMPGFGIYKKGRIVLQDHGDEVWYRNIIIREL